MILPAVSYVLGDSEQDAKERSIELGLQQIGPAQAIAWIENIWGQELPGLDPDGALPAHDPLPEVQRLGHAGFSYERRLEISQRLCALAESKKLSVRSHLQSQEHSRDQGSMHLRSVD